MGTQLNYMQAWRDFHTYIKDSARWAKVDRPGRDRISKAQKRYLHGLPSNLSYDGVKSLLLKYAPERYSFTETIILNES